MMRRRELLQLRWSRIDFEREVVHVVNNREDSGGTKSGKNRQVTDDLESTYVAGRIGCRRKQ